jgi:putative component of membrane protein insertase Oxa1/YidC/SpoIIIJ protein YidD
MKRHLTLLLLSLLLSGLWSQVPAVIAGDDLLHGPWGQGPANASRPKQQSGQETMSAGAFLFRLPIVFFQRVISPVDGDRCPSYPTCSAYSMQAYERHGALLGTLMTVDRLFHEASEAEFAPTIKVHGVVRIYDPVWANEFWRGEKGKTASGK